MSQLNAAVAIDYAGNPARSNEAALDALLDANEAVRLGAIQELIDDPANAPALLKHFANEKTARLRAAIMEGLRSRAAPGFVPGLIELLSSDRAANRAAAIETLHHFPDEVAAHIDTLLADPSPDLRIFTLAVLESLRHPNVEKWLITVLEQDCEVNVCATAIELLGRIGDHRAVPVLHAVKARFHDEPFICFAVDVALGQIE